MTAFSPHHVAIRALASVGWAGLFSQCQIVYSRYAYMHARAEEPPSVMMMVICNDDERETYVRLLCDSSKISSCRVTMPTYLVREEMQADDYYCGKQGRSGSTRSFDRTWSSSVCLPSPFLSHPSCGWCNNIHIATSPFTIGYYETKAC